MIYPWQHDDWARIQALRGQWPHALLLHGQAGTGKAEFARHLAQGLLCEAPGAGGEPCGRCVACTWFGQGNHPDYRIVVPESMAAELAPGSVDDAASETADSDGAKKTKTLSREIKIEQVRALLGFCGVGSHRGGARVVVLYPAEALNAAAANALLKTLEEPPAGVVFLLVSARLDRLLPTIISRCRQWPLAAPEPQAALAWLTQQGVDDAAGLLAEAGGAPRGALALAHEPSHALRRQTLEQLAAGAACDAFGCGEALQKAPVPLVLGWLQRWLFDLMAVKSAGRTRYYPGAAAALARCAAQADAVQLARFVRVVNSQRAVENHPLNARLVIEELMLGYRAIFTA
jgi:DNA polymerase III subunit delta'